MRASCTGRPCSWSLLPLPHHPALASPLPVCVNGCACRRDRKFHLASGLCVGVDYGSVPGAYAVLGDGGFVRGRKLDDDGNSMSEESMTSQSDS